MVTCNGVPHLPFASCATSYQSGFSSKMAQRFSGREGRVVLVLHPATSTSKPSDRKRLKQGSMSRTETGIPGRHCRPGGSDGFFVLFAGPDAYHPLDWGDEDLVITSYSIHYTKLYEISRTRNVTAVTRFNSSLTNNH